MTVEHFDLYDETGSPLGRSKPRSEVHRDGDWHRSVALWIVRPDHRIVLQRRSLSKDTYPGLFTASVSGHYAAGEVLKDVLREAQEEIGVPAQEADLIPIGRWRHDDKPAAAIVDRELQDVFLWPLDRELTEFQPDSAEVAGLAEVAVADLRRLLQPDAPAIPARWVEAGSSSVEHILLTAGALVPTPEYHAFVASEAEQYLDQWPANANARK